MPEFTGESLDQKSSWLNRANSNQEFPPSRSSHGFRSSLSLIVVSVMVFLSLIPVVLIVTGSYLRTRNFILEQTYHQLESLVQSQTPQLSSIALENQAYLTELLSQDQIRNGLANISESTRKSSDRNF
jgi:predicted PurR-regulated permease PerM